MDDEATTLAAAQMLNEQAMRYERRIRDLEAFVRGFTCPKMTIYPTDGDGDSAGYFTVGDVRRARELTAELRMPGERKRAAC